jgi:hypothetical protein
MSDTLTRQHDFRSSVLQSSMWSADLSAKAQALSPVRSFFADDTATFALKKARPYVPVVSVSEGRIPNQELQTNYQTSSAAFTRKSYDLKVEEFLWALSEAIKCSQALVADNEGVPLNIQTWTYATQTISPLIAALDLPSPLLLPLQNGGIGAEWHDFGLNIELRFRSPYQVYVVIEDVRGVVAPFQNFDSNLTQLDVALRELAARKSA